MELGFLNTCNKPLCEYHKYYPIPSQYLDSGETGYSDNKVVTYSYMDIIDDD